MGMIARGLKLVGAVALLLSVGSSLSPASATSPPNLGYSTRWDGGGTLTASSNVDIAQPQGWSVPEYVTLERCLPDGSPCVTAAAEGFYWRILTVTNDPPGTYYKATDSVGTSVSKPWPGPIRRLTLPSVTKPPKVGERPEPVSGTWTDWNWSGSSVVDEFSMSACIDAAGTRCEPVGCALPSRYEGRWLRVSQYHGAPRIKALGSGLGDAVLEDAAPTEPSDLELWPSVIVGRIAAGPPTRDCTLPEPQWLPFDSVRRSRHGNISRWLHLGLRDTVVTTGRETWFMRVSCHRPCALDVRVSRGDRYVTRHLPSVDGVRRGVAISSRQLRRIAGKSGARVKVTVTPEGGAPTSRTVQVRFGRR